MNPLQYRKVYDSSGSFTSLQLIQNGQVINISLAGKGTHFAGFRWHEIKEVVDRFQDEAFNEAQNTARVKES
jgi:hypothetical protein